MTACTQRTAREQAAPVPLSGAAELIRDNLRGRCQSLAELSPEAIDLTSRMLEALHTGMLGRQAELRGPHSPEHRRHQLIGTSALQLEDLAYLLIEDREAVRDVVRIIAQECGWTLGVIPEELDQVRARVAVLRRDLAELETSIVNVQMGGNP